MCETTLFTDATIMCFDRETAFEDRLAKWVYNSTPWNTSVTPQAAMKLFRSTRLRCAFTSTHTWPYYLALTTPCVKGVSRFDEIRNRGEVLFPPRRDLPLQALQHELTVHSTRGHPRTTNLPLGMLIVPTPGVSSEELPYVHQRICLGCSSP